METSGNNQQQFTRHLVVKGMCLRKLQFLFQDLFDATFRYKDSLDIFKCVHVGCL